MVRIAHNKSSNPIFWFYFRLFGVFMKYSALLAVLFSGCLDYNFSKTEDPNSGQGDGLDTSSGDGTPNNEEICNGVDDDGDGQIDEGFPDSDFDGIPDCLDEDCDVETAPAASVLLNEDCLAPDLEVLDPWNVAIEWQYTVSAGLGVIVMPAVGNLTDDNGDGLIDDNDMPDIVFTTWDSFNYSTNRLVALNGDGSGPIFEIPGFDGNAGVAIADVDNDGVSEIIASTIEHQVAAIDGAGNIEWKSQVFSWQMYPQPVVGDLDADGDIEIVFDIAVVEGATGNTVTTLGGVASSWRAPVIADVNTDGMQEILLAENTYAHDGTLLWSVPRSGDSTFQAVADIDGDIGGESFWVTGNQLHIYDDDGTPISTINLNSGSSRPGPPCVADFDGDGQVEVGVPASTEIELFETNGTRLWSAPIQDSSGIAGCSGYDVNGDGAYELLYTDEVILRIFDGASGAVLYDNNSHSSGTLWEYPVVADVDNDGSAEIVIASNSGAWKGITVLGHAGDGWAKSGSTWPVHDYAVSNIEKDGGVPSPAPLSWELYNVFRARPTVDDAANDLEIKIVDVCFSGCIDTSPGQVAVQIENKGGLDIDEYINISLYSLDGDVESLIGFQTLTSGLASGMSSETLIFPVTLSNLGASGLLLRVDDSGNGQGQLNECNESNNTAVYLEIPC